MKYLITGGCGFVGSHLADYLLSQNHEVVALDDFSTGRYSNIEHLEEHPRFSLFVGDVADASLTGELIRECDAVFHLASAVGVKLIMERPVDTIDRIFLGTDAVLKQANKYHRPVLITSTSEVYGKSVDVPFHEDGDRLAGPTSKHRWAYACAKALDEFLALAYWKQTRLPVVVVRLFNTVGPRQTGQYGMVIPKFVEAALRGAPIIIHGTGQQTRCFCHVKDVVEALVGLMHCKEARGQVVNIGATDEVSILSLAKRVLEQTGNTSPLEHISYEEAYGGDFEDMARRVPSIDKIQRLIGWSPRRTLADILDDVIDDLRGEMRSSQ